MQRLFILVSSITQVCSTSAPFSDEAEDESVEPSAPTLDIGFDYDMLNEFNPAHHASTVRQITFPQPETDHYSSVPNASQPVKEDDIPLPVRLSEVSGNHPFKYIGNLDYYNRMVECITSVARKVRIYMPVLGINEEKYKKCLNNRNIVIILDNSGSMNSESDRKSFLRDMEILDGRISRHQEMTAILLFMLQALLKSEVKSVHIEFLNPVRTVEREIIKEINLKFGDDSIQKLYKALTVKPEHGTPLTTTLERLVKKYKKDVTHFVVFTDGVPLSSDEKDSVEGLTSLLKKYFYNEKFYLIRKSMCGYKQTDHLKTSKRTINFVACTGNKREVEYLNEIDDKSINIDVTSDYYTELSQIEARLGQQNDSGELFAKKMDVYIYKALVGCLDLNIDKLDKKKKK